MEGMEGLEIIVKTGESSVYGGVWCRVFSGTKGIKKCLKK